MIHFETDRPSQLLVNPQLSVEEKKILSDLKEKFETQFPKSNFFFVASSGSSQAITESVKLIALTRSAVLNSALRFNQFFKASSKDSWGLVLPSFHVAGLSVLARAHLAGSEVIKAQWSIENIKAWFSNHKISFLSLVPAQVYDLVQLNLRAPSDMKKVFVGAGVLNAQLKTDFTRLGWPVVETYGMTETCSMIAVRQEDMNHFEVLPQVQVQAVDGLLQIRCDSMATAFIQKKQDHIFINEFNRDWLQTEDQVILHSDGIQFLGRSNEYIKILGEGVSLMELRQKLVSIASALKINPSQIQLMTMPDARIENLLVVAVENSVSNELIEASVDQFNQLVRGYEKIQKVIRVEKIPLTDLGKVKTDELKQLVFKQLGRRSDDKKI